MNGSLHAQEGHTCPTSVQSPESITPETLDTNPESSNPNQAYRLRNRSSPWSPSGRKMIQHNSISEYNQPIQKNLLKRKNQLEESISRTELVVLDGPLRGSIHRKPRVEPSISLANSVGTWSGHDSFCFPESDRPRKGQLKQGWKKILENRRRNETSH